MLIKRDNVAFVGGDFNMALFQVRNMLREHDIDATFLGSYVWRAVTRGRGEAGLPGCRYDSLGLFAVVPVSNFTRLIRVPMLQGDGATELDEFETCQGYPESSYLGGQEAILANFTQPRHDIHGGGDDLPDIKQKRLRPEVWDATGHLMGHGAHMPLLFYVGDRSRRSSEALESREQKMIRRGWGPASANRAKGMAMHPHKGKGKAADKGKGKGDGDGKGTGAA